MNLERNPHRVRLAVLRISAGILASSWALAQGGEAPDPVRPCSSGPRVQGTGVRVPEAVAWPGLAPNLSLDSYLTREQWEQSEEAPKVRTWGMGTSKSYLIPALEIPAFLFLLNQYDRAVYPNAMEPSGEKTYSTNWSTTQNHILHGKWVIDRDGFAMNQFNHPYQGATFHGFARSAGLNYWESWVYDNAGSLLWKMGGETGNPSRNDMITTGTAGSFLGEVLFRMSSMMLEGDGGQPGFWRKVGATMLSPTAGFNRYVFGDRFKPMFTSNDPAYRWRLQLGENLHSDLNNGGVTSTDKKPEVALDYSMEYGLPGKAGYTYDRPFDYFNFEFRTFGNLKNPVDNIMIRGLLCGTDYELGDSYQGIWGLYGGYDYISPYIFRVSSTSVSLGTTFQRQFSKGTALQGSLLAGVGYAAAGNVAQVGERDYHYGVAPQGLVALRWILGDWAMFDLTGRRYYLTGMGGDDPGGREAIVRLNAGFTVRIYDRHAIGIQYITSSRNAHYPDRADSRQTVGTVAIVYNLLGHAGFGATQ
jgi:hypothetical protein